MPLFWHVAEYGEEPLHGVDARVEIGQVELFVGGVEVVVRETEAHQDAGDAEFALEEADDGDGAAGAHVDGGFLEGLGEGVGGGVEDGVIGIDDAGRAGAEEFEAAGYAAGRGLGDGGFEGGENGVRILAGDQAATDFGVGFSGDDRFEAFVDEAADDAVDFKGRP